MDSSVPLPYTLEELKRYCRRITTLRPQLAIGDSQYVVHRIAVEELQPMQEVSEHAHSQFEAFVLLDGMLEHQVEGNVKQFTPGCVILHTPLIPHATAKSPDHCVKFVVDFSIYPTPHLEPMLKWAYWPDVTEDAVALLRETAMRLPGWSDRIHFRLATLLSRLMSLVDTAPRLALDDESLPDLVGKVDRYLRANLDESITLLDVADAAGMSERSLMRHFRRLTGTTVHRYLAQLRMDQAGRLLMEQPEAPLHEICLQVGIPDASYFARLFRRHHQHTPHQHRETELLRKRRKR